MTPTKMGSGDKETGYIVGQSNVRKLGIFLIAMSVLFIIVGLSLKGDIETEKEAQQVYTVNARQNKKVLFKARHHEMADAKQEEMKLVKVLALMQAHFGRDRRERTHLASMKADLSTAVRQHDEGTHTVLRQVEANKDVYTYMKQELEAANAKFHTLTDSLIQQYGADLRQEGIDAEGRLKTLTQTVLDELDSEMAEEKREASEEQELEREDPQWKQFTKENKDPDWNRKSKDEKDVEAMLSQLYNKVSKVSQPQIPRKMIKLCKRLSNEYNFAPKLNGGKNKAKIAKEMRNLLTTVQYMPRINKFTVSENKLNELFYSFVSNLEDSWETFDKLDEVAPILKPSLEQWRTTPRKISTSEMFMHVEQLVKARKLRPSWLTPGEAEEEDFLQFSTKDHQKDEGIEPVLIKDQRFKPKRLSGGK